MEPKRQNPKSKSEYQIKLTDMIGKSQPKPPQQKPKSLEKKGKDAKEKQQEEQKKERSSDSNMSAKTQQIVPILYNAEFYRNVRQSTPHGAKIDRIHKQWFKNYDLLEKHHGYIQWIFPNLFQSRFNSQSYAIAPEQIHHFLNEQAIYNRLITSYQMMLAFYGMHLKNKFTGQIDRSRHPHYRQRYEETLLKHFHNHMRITRILSSLTLLGFATYAKELVKFLQKEVENPDGGLYNLKKYNVYEKEWKEFGTVDPSKENVSGFFKKNKHQPVSKPIEKPRKSSEKQLGEQPSLMKKESMMKDSK